MEHIIKDFCSAWQTLDAELITRHLADCFVYDSQWVFSSLDCNGYKDYIQGKFQTLKDKGIKIETSIIDDPHLGRKMLMLNQNGSVCYYRIKVAEGKVIKGDLCMF